ncbi:uncharacterized protein LOC107607543 [Arachis ipaensis]|uniref:uncharacterized protein LOC107607543 n=1 Tax=Arachis ipaensis TaxID=130454 RepID=UPI0007AF2C4A|nr:uncharacterized protein LOC107607543 [Arachis ipaensis]XP_025665053.1 uncharacterized protein LOC112763649 [Arachis hypogaea]
MYLVDASDATHCKAFPTILTKAAMKWYDGLPLRSVANFNDLARKFLTRFFIQKDKTKHALSLLGVKQMVGETLRDYIERFNKACLKIQSLPTEVIIMGLVNGLREGPFSHSISKRYPTSLNEVQERAEKYINMEKNSRLRESPLRSFLPFSSRDKEREPKKKEDPNIQKPRKYNNYTFPRVSLVDVYREICHTEKLPPPHPIKHKKAGSRTEYCEYHKLYRHSTNECYDLKNIIEKLAGEGRLDRYLADRSDDPRKRRRDEEGGQPERPPHTPERHIHMINGGFVGGKMSKSSQKRRLKEVYQVGESSQLTDLPTISFIKKDAQGLLSGHDDPIVIKRPKDIP